MTTPNTSASTLAPNTVLVVDYGGPHAQLVARNIRQVKVYSEVIPQWRGAQTILDRQPAALVLVGGSEDDGLVVEPALLESGIPVLATGAVHAKALATNTQIPELAEATIDTAQGQETLSNFLFNTAGITPEWTVERFIEDQVAAIKAQIGNDRAICGLSGGVDSAVAAALVQKAVGEQLVCVYVNTGLMRKNESEQIEEAFGASTGGARLVMVDAEEEFLTALKGVSEPETKRKIIGEKFIRVFEQAQANIIAESAEDPHSGDVKFLVQGTIYPDIVESGAGDGTAVIKSHHNVGGLPDDIEFELVEPLQALFKDEVREVGTALGLPDEIVYRQPFPGPGLGVRVIGSLTKERLDTLRAADAIVREEVTKAGLDRSLWQFPVVLLADVRSVGVTNEARTYGHPIVLRPVHSVDAMTADWAELPNELIRTMCARITAEVPNINRVVLDVTPKPPGTIEWE